MLPLSLTHSCDAVKAAEAKQRRKDENLKKSTKAGEPVEEVQESSDGGSDGEGSEIVFDGISGVQAHASSKVKTSKAKAVEVEVEEEDVPILINPNLPTLQSVLDEADVLLHILDARDPLSHRSSHLEELVSTKSSLNSLFILNKIGRYCKLVISLY
jgi:nuclear GTP-binding protein